VDIKEQRAVALHNQGVCRVYSHILSSIKDMPAMMKPLCPKLKNLPQGTQRKRTVRKIFPPGFLFAAFLAVSLHQAF
jgi:hypothetical protein